LTPPSISIVTPSFNQAKFLEHAIQSVLCQKYPHLEYIIIDGGSTDGSVDIIKKYENELTYWISEKDNGQTHALNKGFRKATGEIVAWLNSDDIYPPNTFHLVSKEFVKDSKLDIVYGNKAIINEEGVTLDVLKYTRVLYPMLIAIGSVLPQPSAFWRRNIFERVGYLDESLHFVMDREFMCRAAFIGRSKHIRRVTCLFRHHENQKSKTISDIGLKEGKDIEKRFGHQAYGLLPKFFVKTFCHFARIIFFIMDGELFYVTSGLKRRFTNPLSRRKKTKVFHFC